MRLADLVIAGAGGGALIDNKHRDAIGLGADVARAECFELSDEVRDACYQVAQSKPSSIVSALPLTRLPYGKTWIEWRGEADGTNPAVRFGCLFRSSSDTLSSGAMDVIMSDEVGLVTLSLAMFFDWSAPPDPWRAVADILGVTECPPPISFEDQNREAMRESSYWKGYAAEASEVDAAIDFTRHYLCSWSPYFDGQKVMHERLEGTVRCLSSLLPFVTAFIVMLNAKGAVATQKDDLSRLNRRRIAAKKPPLREFVVTRLNLSKGRAERGAAMGLSREASRRHLVRGHFKVRKSGIYWWSPFVRGIGGVVPRERYAVG